MDRKQQIKQAVQVSKLYYLDGATQAEIGKKLNLSRPTISRLLQFAREKNIVKISINDPLSNIEDLQHQLKEKYQLKDVVITTPESNETAEILSSLGKATARYLDKKVEDNDVIGVSWGRTLASVARQLIPNDRKNIQVVYLKGTVANSTHNNYVVEVTKCFNKCYHTQAQILPLPLIFENKQIKEMVIKDKFINEILDTGKRTSVALFTVGTTEQDSTLFELGYFNDQQIKTLQEKAAGDLVSRFIDEHGKIVDDQLNDRTVAIALDNLKQARESVLIAGGMNKLKAIKAALAGKYANVLITDSLVAQHLL